MTSRCPDPVRVVPPCGAAAAVSRSVSGTGLQNRFVRRVVRRGTFVGTPARGQTVTVGRPGAPKTDSPGASSSERTVHRGSADDTTSRLRACSAVVVLEAPMLGLRARRSVAVGVVAALLGLAVSATADTGPKALGISSFDQVVVDEAHGHLFLTAGRTGAGVTVTDLAGSTVTSVPAFGATGLALTPDGRSLWTGSPSGLLRRIDTVTLTVVETIALPTGQCPGDLAVVGTRLVYGYSCATYGGSGPYGGIGMVDTTTGRILGTVTSGPSYRPVVAAGPAGQVYAADSQLSPTNLYLYDVSGQSPRLVGSRFQICSNLTDLDARPDGSQVVTSCGGTYDHDVYSSYKLEFVGAYGAQNPYQNAGA